MCECPLCERNITLSFSQKHSLSAASHYVGVRCAVTECEACRPCCVTGRVCVVDQMKGVDHAVDQVVGLNLAFILFSLII